MSSCNLPAHDLYRCYWQQICLQHSIKSPAAASDQFALRHSSVTQACAMPHQQNIPAQQKKQKQKKRPFVPTETESLSKAEWGAGWQKMCTCDRMLWSSLFVLTQTSCCSANTTKITRRLLWSNHGADRKQAAVPPFKRRSRPQMTCFDVSVWVAAALWEPRPSPNLLPTNTHLKLNMRETLSTLKGTINNIHLQKCYEFFWEKKNLAADLRHCQAKFL